MTLLKNEPVVTGIVGLLAALCALLVAFGVDLTETQTAALLAFAGAALQVARLVRSKVAPV